VVVVVVVDVAEDGWDDMIAAAGFVNLYDELHEIKECFVLQVHDVEIDLNVFSYVNVTLSKRYVIVWPSRWKDMHVAVVLWHCADSSSSIHPMARQGRFSATW